MHQFVIVTAVFVGLIHLAIAQGTCDPESGKVFKNCGSPCTLTCDNYQSPPICLTVCSPGCFCPDGTVEHDGRCISPQECSATTEPPTSECPEGKVYTDCGSPCPASCDNLDNNFCAQVCTPGCFCPSNMVELGDSCVLREDCPSSQCAQGKSYSTCGSACPLTCENLNQLLPCPLICAEGCFCQPGTVELGNDCVPPEECPQTCTGGKEYKECGPVCKESCDSLYGDVPNPCFSLLCVSGCFCPGGTVEHDGECIKPTECYNHPCTELECPSNYHCELDQTSLRPYCEQSLYVPCTRDTPLQCDSDFLRCVMENTTSQATCLPSCFLNNGDCRQDQICVVSNSEEHDSSVECLNSNELSTECPAGMVINQCGSLCQGSCDNIVQRDPHVCPLVCGPPDCACPRGLVLYRDRCVSPKECYSLEIYPPALQPLPLVRSDTGLLKLSHRNPSVSMTQFQDLKGEYVDSIQDLLNEESGVIVRFHAALENDQGFDVYLSLSGGDISDETLEAYTQLIAAANSLTLSPDSVEVVDVPRVTNNLLTTEAWIAIGVSAAALLLIAAIVVISVIICCIYRKNVNTKNAMIPDEKEVTMSKLVNEGVGDFEKM